ncbi:YidH family protein [Brevibacterium litoralis]|uniref:YidH family protein n=1 Tax=Brevibacterium litoralis TaxID=3138935 RepID=UPI0032EED233
MTRSEDAPETAEAPDTSPSSPPGEKETSAEALRDDRDRLARVLLPTGAEPDPRFTLANERTFLAWIRTALALMAGGIAVEAFTMDLFTDLIRKGLSILLLLLGMALAAGSAVRWLRIERAMRHRKALPLPLIVPFISIISAVAAGALVVVIGLR